MNPSHADKRIVSILVEVRCGDGFVHERTIQFTGLESSAFRLMLLEELIRSISQKVAELQS